MCFFNAFSLLAALQKSYSSKKTPAYKVKQAVSDTALFFFRESICTLSKKSRLLYTCFFSISFSLLAFLY